MTQYFVLEWEWAPKFCWGGNCQWFDKIDGYRIYEYDTATLTRKLITDIKQPNQKIAAIPVAWGTKCYAVVAYVLDPGVEPSNEAQYCGSQPPAKKITLMKVAEWLTTEDVLYDGDKCVYTQANMLHQDKPGFGTQAGEVFVGAGIFEKDQSIGISYCFMDEYYQGGIKFNMTTEIPINAVIQKAILRFTSKIWAYGGGGVAAPAPATCASYVEAVNKSWSAMIDDDHWVKGTLPYGGPGVSLTGYSAPQVDVTSIVAKWIKKPSSNNGFVLKGWYPALPTEDENSSVCVSTLSNFQLDIYYFAP